MLKSLGVIPARYASVRFPGKVLAEIAGKPLIFWTYEGAKSSRLLDHLLVATDDERVAERVEHFGIDTMITSINCKSGTDRVAEVAEKLRFYDLVVNIQGDEPLITGTIIDSLIEQFEIHPDITVATIISPILSIDEFNDPNVVKVVTDSSGFAIYFSRLPIPYETEHYPPKKHIGIYAYRWEELMKLSQLKPTRLEKAERLEQLRAIENGIKIFCHELPEAVDLISVDTKEDLIRVEEIVKNRE
jgi:3-deoxy-manno-octulosonate cytidylyltransferase (CMP-KDO synthetase)